MKNIKIKVMNMTIKQIIKFIDSLSDDEVRSLCYGTDNLDVKGVIGQIKSRDEIF